jgi:hypothetical protein
LAVRTLDEVHLNCKIERGEKGGEEREVKESSIVVMW